MNAMEQLSSVKLNAPQQCGLVQISSWTWFLPLLFLELFSVVALLDVSGDISASYMMQVQLKEEIEMAVGHCLYLYPVLFSLLDRHCHNGLWFVV